MFDAHSHSEEQNASKVDRMEEDSCCRAEEVDEKRLESEQTASPGASGSQTAAESRGRSWWMSDDGLDRSDRRPVSGCSRWQFSSIPFPDLGSADSLSSGLLPPDPSLLPGSLAVGVCDVTPWRQRINLREVKMSSKEQRREEDKQRRRWDINQDRRVCRPT